MQLIGLKDLIQVSYLSQPDAMAPMKAMATMKATKATKSMKTMKSMKAMKVMPAMKKMNKRMDSLMMSMKERAKLKWAIIVATAGGTCAIIKHSMTSKKHATDQMREWKLAHLAYV
jgi:ribonuclease D